MFTIAQIRWSVPDSNGGAPTPDALGRSVRLRVSTNAIKSVDRRSRAGGAGGLSGRRRVT